MSSVDTTK
jgi:hypothetical protein